MAKAKAGGRKMPATAAEPMIRHARIELPDEAYQRLKKNADRFQLSVSAYIRLAVMERIEADEARGGSK
jgi:hypothetical protein